MWLMRLWSWLGLCDSIERRHVGASLIIEWRHGGASLIIEWRHGGASLIIEWRHGGASLIIEWRHGGASLCTRAMLATKRRKQCTATFHGAQMRLFHHHATGKTECWRQSNIRK
jgi:hypothetical protein